MYRDKFAAASGNNCARDFCRRLFSKACRIANHRKELRDKSIGENNAIFAFYYIGMQKWHLFDYRQVSHPAAASGKNPASSGAWCAATTLCTQCGYAVR